MDREKDSMMRKEKSKMKYGTVGEWLNSESCNTYDFVEDTQKKSGQFEDYGKLQEDPYVKFLKNKFKASTTKPNWNILQKVERI